MALFGSTLTGVFLLGVFTKRANGIGAAVGVVASISTLIVLKILKEDSPVPGILTAATGVLTCVIVGYIASLFVPAASRSLAGLTVATLGEQTPTDTAENSVPEAPDEASPDEEEAE